MKKNQNGFGVIETVLIAIAVIVLVTLGWIVWRAISHKDAKPVPVSDTTASQSAQSSDANTTTVAEYYQINSQRIEIKKDDSIHDIQASVDGKNVYFTLTGFLNSANAAGYSLITDGVNDCERLAGATIFQNASEVRVQGTSVTGDLIDENGNPVEGRVIKLADGRYAEPFNHQASCGKSSFDGSALQAQETAANAAIRNALANNLRSY